MGKQKQKLTPEKKAEIALRAIKNGSVKSLAEEHEITEGRIKKWANRIQNNASDLLDPEAASQHESDLFKNVQQVIPSGLMLTNLEGEIIAFNQQCIDIWDVPRPIAEKSDIYAAMDYVEKQLADPEQFRQTVQKMYANPEMEVNDRFVFRDGRCFQRHSIPHRRGDAIVGRLTSFLDITDYVKAEEKAIRFGSMVDSITKNVSEGILRSTPEEGLVYVNDAFISMFGYDSKQEVLQTDPEKFYYDKSQRWKLVKKMRQDKKVVNEEVRFRRKDGSYFWGLENSTLVEHDGQVYIDAVVNDIGELKQTEQALRESEKKYRTILRSIEEGYFETDLEGSFTFFNRALQQMIGYSRDKLLGMNNREYMDEKNARKVYKVFKKVYETGEPELGVNWELIRQDGSWIHVEVSVNLRMDSNDNPIGFRGIARNVTERKRKEQQIKASLKEKEVLLGEIHHRVKNNLAVISGLLFLQAENAKDPAAQQLLQQSQSRINSMASVHEMLYKNQTFSSVDPGRYIEQLVNYIRKNFNSEQKNIALLVEADAVQLDMNVAIPCALIINELVTNAFKYAFENRTSGTIRVELKENNQQFRLVVVDDGIGMDKEIPKNENNGLGLYLVKTFKNQLEGTLSVDSERGEGTRFVITFRKQ